MILSQRQQEILKWYWIEHHTYREIADWLGCSWRTVAIEIRILRAIFASHKKELPRFNKGRPRTMPDPALVGQA